MASLTPVLQVRMPELSIGRCFSGSYLPSKCRGSGASPGFDLGLLYSNLIVSPENLNQALDLSIIYTLKTPKV